jgi:transposase
MPVTEIDYKNAYLELLPKYQQLQKEFDQFHISYAQLKSDQEILKFELEQLKRMIFGSKSERFVPSDIGQLSLDLDMSQPIPERIETEQIFYTRKKADKNKNKPVRLSLPSHLHRKEIVINPPQAGIEGAKKIGEEITEILEYIPGKFYVEKYVRPKYLLPENKGIVIGELPSFPIPKGNAGAGVLAHLLTSKFVDHLPFYRQVQQFKRQDITIAESTISGWFTASCRLLAPLYDILVRKIQQSNYLMADETPISVLTSQNPGSTHKGYHWVYYSPPDKLVCFDYQKGRGRDGPKEFLKDFKGALQSDGWQAYDMFENKNDITLLACMAHARRKFEHALENDPKRAQYALEKFSVLYMTEREARECELDYNERKNLREEKSLPVLDELKEWLINNKPEVAPKSPIGVAINYTLKLWNRLIRYIHDGNWEIDNNLVENSIRPVALGRKNYLFAGSHEAAQQAAMIYSFLGTCKLNNIEPFQWLKDTLSRIPDHSIQKLEELLPGHQKM